MTDAQEIVEIFHASGLCERIPDARRIAAICAEYHQLDGIHIAKLMVDWYGDVGEKIRSPTSAFRTWMYNQHNYLV